jgi:small-conductance mechanosensitive channel
MDHMESLDSGMQMDKSLTDKAQEYLLTACKWAKFIAIVGFVVMGLVICGIIGALCFMGGNIFDGPDNGAITLLIGLVYGAILLANFFPLKYLYNFSIKTREGIETSSTDTITEGIENLKSFFKFIGVFTAIVLGFYAIIIVFGGIVSVFA